MDQRFLNNVKLNYRKKAPRFICENLLAESWQNTSENFLHGPGSSFALALSSKKNVTLKLSHNKSSSILFSKYQAVRVREKVG